MKFNWFKTLVITCCMGIVSSSMYAENENGRMVIGGIVTTKNDTPIDFATVHLSGTHFGCLTDDKGAYKLEVPAGAYRLVVSSLGYKQQEIPVEVKSHLNLNVTLEENEHMLDEVVITAKTDSRKEREKGFAISAIDTKKAAFSKGMVSYFTR